MDVSVAFSPFVPVWLVAAFAVVGLTLAGLGVVRHVRGSAFRLVAVALFAIALLNPALQREIREPLDGVVAVVVDRSQSQRTAGRLAATDRVAADLTRRLEATPGLEVRTLTVDRPPADQDGTALFGPLADLLGDVPPDRIAGAVMVTDGQVHDVPETAPFNAPLHALVVGEEDERDRRIEIVAAPRFGLVGSTQTIKVRVEDAGAAETSVPLEVRIDDEVVETRTVTVGEEVEVAAPIKHGGDNFFQFAVPSVPGELTDVNNTAVAIVEGVRENLRVLLVSGEPHAGERTWRNLLKSDASVDLVHFTILRPPEKQDGTPINELSLIAFPTRELFSQKIDEFDLIVFDRYHRRNVLPSLYFDNIAQYVLNGGAVLIAAGPDYAGPRSIYHTPLAAALPAAPSGDVIEAPFRPAVSERGARHPVTRELPGSEASPPAWSDWFRQVETIPVAGETVMTGANASPLLTLSREGEGRVAMMMSDHIWLWARGFDGGGPHVPLMRRLSHWLMKEPELEEEALRLDAGAGSLTIERQTLADGVAPVTLTTPSGETQDVTLEESAPGLWTADIADPEMGLYRATDGTLTALGHVGPANPLEARDLRSDTERLAPIAEATRGSVRRVNDVADTPRILMRTEGRAMAGSDWLGLRQSEASELVGVDRLPLFAGFLGLAFLIAAVGGTWWREGH
ncbi:hypothetical protein [Acuticoccus mangrovi]|uniref:Glutamine amidotransferase domain-containing protein n=1 Tax=Acuticoccus mangrovi TaxID=2796142 RepID=A0A934ILD8_9HYPH|nr:hypothetical protein [Acuticoccus mangrovi]MBJ3775952.1 hypothetical protein [Acuticoccus mangrovi]